MSNEFGKDHGLISEAVVTGRKVGAGIEFWAALAHNEKMFADVVAFVAAKSEVVFRLNVQTNYDVTRWRRVSPPYSGPDEFRPVLQKFLGSREPKLLGRELALRAETLGISSTGLLHAEGMMREADKIPASWRKYSLLFPEMWRDSEGIGRLFYLRWTVNHWTLVAGYLAENFGRNCRLVGTAK